MKHSKDPLGSSSQDTPAGNRKDRLEDILNDLMKLEGLPPLGTPAEEKNESAPPKKISSETAKPEPDSKPLSFDAKSSGSFFGTSSGNFTTSPGVIPPNRLGERLRHWRNIASELSLAGSAEDIFRYFKAYHQNNRHKPVIKLLTGLVLYVEYDVEMERIRIFVGNETHFSCIARGMRELSGMLAVEEVYEYRLETRTRDMLGFKRVENTVHERQRLGRELLSPRELNKTPVLYFTIYNDKGTGVSSCTIQAEENLSK